MLLPMQRSMIVYFFRLKKARREQLVGVLIVLRRRLAPRAHSAKERLLTALRELNDLLVAAPLSGARSLRHRRRRRRRFADSALTGDDAQRPAHAARQQRADLRRPLLGGRRRHGARLRRGWGGEPALGGALTCVLARQYGGGACDESSGSRLLELVPGFKDDVRPVRDWPLAAWARELYRTDRAAPNARRAYA